VGRRGRSLDRVEAPSSPSSPRDTARAMGHDKGENVESETQPLEEPHPDEQRGNGETTSDSEDQGEGKAGEHHPDEAPEPDKGLPE
jgi:hypothetical protein